MRCITVRPVAFEDLGVFEPELRRRGYSIDYRQAGIDAVTPDEWRHADLVVVLGGPIGAYDADAYPWLGDLIDAMRGRVSAARPLIGICLGAQLIASALGARVRPGAGKEIGWGELTLTAAGRDSALRHLAGVPVLHWHGDTFDLPAGTRSLASTPMTANQAFAVGRHALALQFHPEADAARIEAWLIGHTIELAAAGCDVRALRAASQAHGAVAAEAGRAMLGEWLAGLR